MRFFSHEAQEKPPSGFFENMAFSSSGLVCLDMKMSRRFLSYFSSYLSAFLVSLLGAN